MSTQEKIDSIKQKITQVNQERTARGKKLYILNPTLSEAEIQVFENQHHIQLPEEYRAFLLQVGNGNQETYSRGINRLEDSIKFHYLDEEYLDLQMPFPFTEAIGREIIEEMHYQFYPAEKVRQIVDTIPNERLCGCLLLNYEGWGSSHTALVVSGSERGRVWLVDDLYHLFYTGQGDKISTFSFLDWLIDDLDDEFNLSGLEQIKSANYLIVKYLDLQGESQNWQKEIKLEDIFKCTNLEFLDLSRNYNLQALPDDIGKLQNLIELKFSGGSLKKLPDAICNLKNLEILELSYQSFRTLPAKIGNLTQLKRLSLYWNSHLRRLPKSFAQLKELAYLDLGYCENLDLRQVLPLLGQLPKLKKLSFRVSEIPEEIQFLTNIESLSIVKEYGNENVILSDKIGTLTQLKSLSLIDCGLTQAPNWITQLINLEYLILGENPFKTLPKNIGNLLIIKYIHLKNTQLSKLPPSFSQLQNLSEIEIGDCPKLDLKNALPILGKLLKIKQLYIDTKKEIPKEIGSLIHLPELILSLDSKKERAIPLEIRYLQNLDFLKIETYGKLILPPEISELKKLEILRIEAKKLQLPDNFGDLENLIEIDFSDCELTHLPVNFGQLKNLEILYLEGNPELDLKDTFEKIAQLSKLKKLRVSAKNLPPEIGLCTQLEHLEIYNHPKYKNYNIPLTLPTEIGNLTNLKHLDLEENHLKEIPETIGNLKKLQYLALNENQLTELPTSICWLVNLRELYLFQNKLTVLPYYIGNLQELVFLDIADNQFVRLPNGFIKLFRLRTLYLKNNPWGDIAEDLENLPSLKETDL
jgi:Leucine-rich repeat (LRR) protein